MLAAHIRLLVSHHASLGAALLPPKANTPDKILRVARKHVSKAPTRSTVWLARLSAEKQFAEPKDVEQAWSEARKRVEGDGIQDVWLWGLDPENRAMPRPTGADETPSSMQHRGSEVDVNAEVQLLEVRVYRELHKRPRCVLTDAVPRTAFASREPAYPRPRRSKRGP